MRSIKVTDPQPGDYWVGYVRDVDGDTHPFTGSVWGDGSVLLVGATVIGADNVVMTRATRQVPDLPTVPGSIIYNVQGKFQSLIPKFRVAVLRPNGDWAMLSPDGIALTVRPNQIEFWTEEP